MIQRNDSCTLFYGKMDLMSAFRVLPLAKKYWRLLILKAHHPRTKKYVFFVNKNLPFGASISCAHFQELSQALRHIVEMLTGCVHSVTNFG